MSMNEKNQGSSDETPKPDPTGNPSDVTPEPDVTPKPRRRDILAGMAFGLGGVAGRPRDCSPAVAEAGRLIDVMLKVRETERNRRCRDDDEADASLARVRDAATAAALAIRRCTGIPETSDELAAVAHGGRLFVAEGSGSRSETVFGVRMDVPPELWVEEIDLARVAGL
jgi:hypothetical protein